MALMVLTIVCVCVRARVRACVRARGACARVRWLLYARACVRACCVRVHVLCARACM